jgi:RimJ/RimL family protein N-acetyltransferase
MEILTPRLRLVPIGLENADDLLRIHRDPAVVEWYGEMSDEEVITRAGSFGEQWRTNGVSKWLAYEKAHNDLVGRGGLSRVPVEGREQLELGWALLGAYWGYGYATEIGRAGLDFAFDRLDADEVIAFTEARNNRSRAVMERLGMSYSHEMVDSDEPFVLYRIARDG